MNKCVLAFSGGLDTTAILFWLKNEMKLDVYPVLVNLGQDDDFEPIRLLAKQASGNNLRVLDVRDEFCKEYIFESIKAHAVYEENYLLGTALSRPLIAKTIGLYAKEIGAAYFVHGATGRGNDQIRFEFAIARLFPELKVIAPWREWGPKSRIELIEYCSKNGFKFESKANKTYSIDANCFHTSYEGEDLESTTTSTPCDIWNDKVTHNKSPVRIKISFTKGIPTALDDILHKPFELLNSLNKLASQFGIGRLDLVENRMIGLKSRGCYETPAGTVLLFAHRELESICLDIGSKHLKDRLSPEYAQIVYKAGWFTPEREMLQAAIEVSQKYMTGSITLELSNTGIKTISRDSKFSLYSQETASFDDLTYNHNDATGFINLGTIRLKSLFKQGLE